MIFVVFYIKYISGQYCCLLNSMSYTSATVLLNPYLTSLRCLRLVSHNHLFPMSSVLHASVSAIYFPLVKLSRASFFGICIRYLIYVSFLPGNLQHVFCTSCLGWRINVSVSYTRMSTIQFTLLATFHFVIVRFRNGISFAM